MNTIITMSILILSLIVGIAYHEYGHMSSALKRGVEVKSYQIGFCKKLAFWKHTGKNGVEYRITPVLLGGECGISDEKLYAANTKNFVAIVSAGAGRNFVLGFVLIAVGYLVNHFSLGGSGLGIIDACQSAANYFFDTFKLLGDMIRSMFDIKTFTEYGGFVGSFSSTGSVVESMNLTAIQGVYMGLTLGGLMNFTLGFFNLIPFPGLDGGQIFTKLVCRLIHHVFHHDVSDRVIGTINLAGFILLFSYQFFILAFDLPFFRAFMSYLIS